MKRLFFIVFLFLFIFVGLSGFRFSDDHTVDPIRKCFVSRIDSLSFEDLLWFYQQQDTLSEFSNDQNLILGIKGVDSTTTFRSFGQFHPSLDSLGYFELYALRLIHQHSEIASFWNKTLKAELDSFSLKKDSLSKIFPSKPYRMRFVSENRSLAKQIELHKKGKSKIMLSLHNFGLAADVGIYRYKRYMRRGNMYQKMGLKAKELGLTWGGDFVGFPDPGHIQAFSNSANLIQRYPILAFEFEKYKVQYENTYLRQVNNRKAELVEDTKSLLENLNSIRLNKNCLCSKAIMPPKKDEITKLITQFISTPQAVVYVDLLEQWAYVQKGQTGYFYQLGTWKLDMKE